MHWGAFDLVTCLPQQGKEDRGKNLWATWTKKEEGQPSLRRSSLRSQHDGSLTSKNRRKEGSEADHNLLPFAFFLMHLDP